MTIRSGGRPRDGRPAPVRPYDPESYATASIPEFSEPIKRGRGGRGGGGAGSGLVGLLKFLVFALVLAAIVLGVALTVLRPVVGEAVMAVAEDNPAALRLPFVEDIVRENLGTALTQPASSASSQVEFLVEDGDTASTIAARLEEQGLIRDRRAFVFISTVHGLTGSLQQGTFVLRENMTPDQVVNALLAPPKIPYVDIALRTGLRLEQITAKLQTLPLDMDPHEFYDLAKSPPASLINDYPWLKKILADAPKGASLEGFLWPATYRVLPDTTPEELIRLMLDRFAADVGPDRMNVPKDRGLDFYQVLSLASIVEREAVLDEERARIAGVYQNRLDGLPGIKNKILNADPTVFYAIDTMELAKLKFADWQRYVFWSPPGVSLSDLVVPPELQGYQTYQTPGLIPGPIATPSLPSIDAALEPDTQDKYLYFLAIPDGGGAHVFAKTKAEHDANRKKYGYLK
jgi:peptidoglycan lytic transglycosylase G